MQTQDYVYGAIALTAIITTIWALHKLTQTKGTNQLHYVEILTDLYSTWNSLEDARIKALNLNNLVALTDIEQMQETLKDLIKYYENLRDLPSYHQQKQNNYRPPIDDGDGELLYDEYGDQSIIRQRHTHLKKGIIDLRKIREGEITDEHGITHKVPLTLNPLPDEESNPLEDDHRAPDYADNNKPKTLPSGNTEGYI